MPLHRDFMMRVIQSLANAFFRILAGKAVEAPAEARDEIEDHIGEVLGVRGQFVLGQGTEAMAQLDPPVAAEVSRLLFLHAELSERTGERDQALRACQMAFAALERSLEPPYTDRTKLGCELLDTHFDTILALFGAQRVAEVAMQAFRYREARKHWADAENWLFRAVGLDGSHRDEALAFYDRLLNLTDEDLEAGDLPRDEVLESRSELGS